MAGIILVKDVAYCEKCQEFISHSRQIVKQKKPPCKVDEIVAVNCGGVTWEELVCENQHGTKHLSHDLEHE